MQANSFRLRERKIRVDFKGGKIQENLTEGVVSFQLRTMVWVLCSPWDGVNKLAWAVFGWEQVVRGGFDRLGLTERTQIALCCCFGSLKNGVWKQEDKS